jgi:hypothetical protein
MVLERMFAAFAKILPMFTLDNKVNVVPIYDPGDDLCFVFTVGLHKQNLPELLLVDVPVSKLNEFHPLIVGLIDMVKSGKGHHGYKLSWCEAEDSAEWYRVTTLHVMDPQDRENIIQSMGCFKTDADIILVKPIFDEWETATGPPPDGNIDIQKAIFCKWRAQRNADALTLGGNTFDMDSVTNNAPEYLRSSTNWDRDLSRAEVSYVRNHWDYMIRKGLAELCPIPKGPADSYTREVAEKLCEAPSRYNHGIKVVDGTYTWEIKLPYLSSK